MSGKNKGRKTPTLFEISILTDLVQDRVKLAAVLTR